MPESYFDWTARLFDRSRIFEKPEALRGIRVLDLSIIIFGPATADYLGELGAEVIRVEMPGAGDVMRIVAPEGFYWKNVSPAFFAQNHSKYHVGIDVHTPEGQALIKQLVAKSDVLIENFRSGTLERKWGIGYRQLREINPRLIYAANTGFGQWGSCTRRASYDALAQAVSGFTAVSGFPDRPPLKIGIYLGDYFGACLSALGVLAALHHRDRTGQGQFLEVGQCEALLRAMDWTWVHAGLTGKSRAQAGNRDASASPSGIYACKDGFVAVVAGRDEEFRGLCRAMQRDDLSADPRFATRTDRAQEARADLLDQLIGAWARELTRAEVEASGRLHGFSAAAVATAKDHYADAHLRARASVWEMEDPVYGSMVEHGPAPKLSETPARYKWAAKPVGFHNEYVLGRLLGLRPDQIQALERQGVIGKWADRRGPKPPDGWSGEGMIE
ncbi:MAG TPA: CoA transferase [Candidatus Methylomirabilis sp.]|nr:CoA transferase [Candidatus Methylomirabilis sp.]